MPKHTQTERSGDWIKGAVKHPGAVKKAAEKHGRSVTAETKAESRSPNRKIAARGRLALRFKGKAKKGNIKKRVARKG